LLIEENRFEDLTNSFFLFCLYLSDSSNSAQGNHTKVIFLLQETTTMPNRSGHYLNVDMSDWKFRVRETETSWVWMRERDCACVNERERLCVRECVCKFPVNNFLWIWMQRFLSCRDCFNFHLNYSQEKYWRKRVNEEKNEKNTNSFFPPSSHDFVENLPQFNKFVCNSLIELIPLWKIDKRPSSFAFPTSSEKQFIVWKKSEQIFS